jgi:hypothetical protein
MVRLTEYVPPVLNVAVVELELLLVDWLAGLNETPVDGDADQL